MHKVCVVMRQLNGHRPVVSTVINSPPHSACINDIDSWLRLNAEMHKRQIIEEYCEFLNADWYVDIFDMVE